MTPTDPDIFGQARRVSRKVRAHVLALERVRNMHGGPYHPKPENAQPKVQATMATQTEPETSRRGGGGASSGAQQSFPKNEEEDELEKQRQRGKASHRRGRGDRRGWRS